MLYLSIETKKLFSEVLEFGNAYSNRIGEPDSMSDEEFNKFINEQEKHLQVSWNKNKFIIFANLKTNTFDACVRIKEVMGWSSDMSIEGYFCKIHPDYLPAYLTWTLAVYKLSEELHYRLKPLEQIYQLQIPLLHQSRKFFWCTMQAIPVRLDKDRKMVGHFNIYQRLEEMSKFNYRLFQPFLVERLEAMEEWNKRLARKMKGHISDKLNRNEVETIKLGLSGKSTNEIAKETKMSKNTIMKYKKNILKLGNQIGGKVFHEANTVGEYFKLMGWIDE